MGTSPSKPAEDDFQRRSNSIQQSSKKRRSSLSKPDQIENASKVIGNLKNEIDIFAGNRNDSRYKEFQKILTTLAAELQKIKTGSKKQQILDRCDEVQGEIQNCLQRLETRVNFNEQNENSLDLASVESHSFIHNFNQRPPPPALLDKKWAEALPPPPVKQNRQKHDAYKSLDKIEQELQNLQKEIRRSIELEDTKQCVIHENKIKILYTDLELIRIDEHTPLAEKKSAIAKRLIKYNNLIRRFKKSLEKKVEAPEADTKRDGSGFSKPVAQKNIVEDQVDDFTKLENHLGELEIQALTFEGVKTDKKYKELEQILESHWTKLYSIDAFGDEERKRRSVTVDRTKNILQELRNRAEENEKQLKAIKNIHKIEQEFKEIKKEADIFKGTKTDSSYIKLDQELRGLWAKLSEVEEPNEHVRRSKARVINDIQFVLKNLSQNAKDGEEIYQNVSSDDDIFQKQLLKQVEEFQNHWNQLNYNLDVQKVTKSEISFAIIEIFEKILDGVGKKTHALSIIEKKKSNSSLVIAKVIDNTDLLKTIQPSDIFHQPSLGAVTTVTNTENYYSNQKTLTTFKPVTYQSPYHAPDLIQQQAIISPMETEIKVQPTVKIIGEMQRVGTEAKLLLQQIKQSNCTKYDKEYENFQSKLQQCQKTLENIEYNKRSDTIESNRRRVFKTIQEGLRILEEKPTIEQNQTSATRSSRVQEIMDIDAEIQYFRQQIKNFNGVTKDKQYEKIKQAFADCLNKLQVIDDVHMSKQESIRQIQQYHQELETKLAENQAKVKLLEHNAEIRRQTSHDIKGIVEQVQKLRSQVDRFTGAYQGLLYKQIEGNLNNCLEKLEELQSHGDDKLEKGLLLTKQKIQKYLRILEDKSTKTSSPEACQARVVKDEVQQLKASSVSVDQHQDDDGSVSVVHRKKIQRQSQVIDNDSPHHRINSLRDKLVEVKNKTETFTGKYKDEEYSKIIDQLLGYYEELQNINDGGHKSIIISKEQYEDYIDKLLGYFEEKAKISETYNEEKIPEVMNQKGQKFKVEDPTEELAIIEEKILELKPKIDDFDGIFDDVKYKELEEILNSQKASLEKVQAGNVAHVRERKRKLIQEVANNIKFLNDKANNLQKFDPKKYQEELEKINEILLELDEISIEVNNFTGVKNDKKYCYLDELLIKYTIQLDNTETFGKTELRDARKKAIRKIQGNMDILIKRAAPKGDVGGGEVVASNV